MEYSQLSLAQSEHLLGVRSCNHASFPSPQKSIAGHFYVEGQAINAEKQFKENGLAEDSGNLRRGQAGGIQLTPSNSLPEFTS